mmetsp:Transcript_26781/g.66636  ORF Transcript_26781/g.66636 Transcript_26781/m.66636 type:complete len:163 (-) Transcript_26781:667-1155(-)
MRTLLDMQNRSFELKGCVRSAHERKNHAVSQSVSVPSPLSLTGRNPCRHPSISTMPGQHGWHVHTLIDCPPFLVLPSIKMSLPSIGWLADCIRRPKQLNQLWPGRPHTHRTNRRQDKQADDTTPPPSVQDTSRKSGHRLLRVSDRKSVTTAHRQPHAPQPPS